MKLSINNSIMAVAALILMLGATNRVNAAFTIISPFNTGPVTADGILSPGEYDDPGVFVSFHPAGLNPGIAFTDFGLVAPTSDADLSYTVLSTHTNTDLFVAFQVRDEFIDDDATDLGQPFNNDSAEIYIDGDRVANDLIPNDRLGGKEGFQIIADTIGDKFTRANGEFSNTDWSSGAVVSAPGYVVEFQIPLGLIDTIDGAGFTAAATGSVVRFNAAVTDNDQTPFVGQESFGMLWSASSTSSPFIAGETAWEVHLALGDIPEPSTAIVFLGIAGCVLARSGTRRRRR